MLNETKFLELQNRQQESGLNVKEFCLNEGIAPSTFYYWLKKQQKHKQSKGFIPLVVKPAPSIYQRNAKGNGQLLSVDHTQEDAVFLELVYPNGTLLRVKKDLDLSRLRALIHLYE
jgi:transposase-like protein